MELEELLKLRRIHIGSGPHAVEGWINLDVNTFEGWERQPDVLASVFDMNMIPDGSMDSVYLGHVAEHLPLFKVPDALKEIKRVMSPTGVLCLVGPCMDKARETNQPDWLLKEIPRGWDGEGMPDGFPHLWTASTELTRLCLEEVFDKDKIVEVPITEVKLPEWPNTAGSDPATKAGMWQCAFIVTT